MAKNFWALQFLDFASSKEYADELMACLRLQENFLGGRVYHGGAKYLEKTPWVIQAFFEDDPRLSHYPEGFRRTLILPGFAREIGLSEKT